MTQAALELQWIHVREAMSTNQESEGQHGVSNIEPDPANHNDDDSLIDLHPHSDDPHRGIDLRKPAFLRPPTGSGMSCTGAVCGSSDEDRVKSLQGNHLHNRKLKR